MNKILSALMFIQVCAFGASQAGADILTPGGHGCAGCEVCGATSCSCHPERMCSDFNNVIGSGDVWRVSPAISRSAILTNVPKSSPGATFNINTNTSLGTTNPPIDFGAGSATVKTWLQGGSAFNIVENKPGTLISPMGIQTASTLVEFSGFVDMFSGQTFSITLNGSLTLIVGDMNLISVVNPTDTTIEIANFYTGPSGTFPFELLYGECCGGPPTLQVDLPFVSSTSIPEPSTWLLFVISVSGIVVCSWGGNRLWGYVTCHH